MRVSLLLGAPLVLSAALVACAASRPSPAASTTLSSATAEPCRGAQFDADDPDPRCLRNHASAPTPSAKALHVSLHADSVAKSGHEAVLVLEMRNVSGDPLELDVDGACAFDAVATNG